MKRILKIENIFFGLLFSSLSSQTLIFHAAILFNWKLGTAYDFWLLTLPFCTYFCIQFDAFGSFPNGNQQAENLSWKPYLGLLVVLTLYGLMAAVPDSDDMTLLHPALTADFNLSYHLGDTLHNFQPLPQISFLHSLTSYEVFLKFVSTLFRVDLLNFYHNTMFIVWTWFFLAVFRSLFIQLGLRSREVTAALIGVSFLITLELQNPLGFGSVGLTRFFQGKSVLWVSFLPYVFFIMRRTVERPNYRQGIWLIILSVVGVSLNNSGLFLLPVMVGATTLANCLVNSGRSLQKFGRTVYSGLAVSYPMLIVSLYFLGIFPKPKDMSTWVVEWQTNWIKLIGLVLNDGSFGLVTAAIFLLGFFFLFSQKRHTLWLLYYLVALILFCLNPWSSSLWISMVTVGAYWRFAFLLLFPLFFGVVASSLVMTNVRKAVKIFAIVSLGLFLSGPVDEFYKSRYQIKKILDYRLPSAELAFATQARDQLSNASILTTEEMAFTVSLIQPSARFEMTLYGVTVHLFSNIDRKDEGLRRALAQRLIAFGDRSKGVLSAFKESIPNIDAIIVKRPVFQEIEAVLNEHLGSDWRISNDDKNYILLKKLKS